MPGRKRMEAMMKKLLRTAAITIGSLALSISAAWAQDYYDYYDYYEGAYEGTFEDDDWFYDYYDYDYGAYDGYYDYYDYYDYDADLFDWEENGLFQ